MTELTVNPFTVKNLALLRNALPEKVALGALIVSVAFVALTVILNLVVIGIVGAHVTKPQVWVPTMVLGGLFLPFVPYFVIHYAVAKHAGRKKTLQFPQGNQNL